MQAVVEAAVAAVGEAHPFEAVDLAVPLAAALPHVEVEAWLAAALGVVDGAVDGGTLVEVLRGAASARVAALGHPVRGAEAAGADDVTRGLGARPAVPDAGAAAAPLVVAAVLVTSLLLHRRPSPQAADRKQRRLVQQPERL